MIRKCCLDIYTIYHILTAFSVALPLTLSFLQAPPLVFRQNVYSLDFTYQLLCFVLYLGMAVRIWARLYTILIIVFHGFLYILQANARTVNPR